MNVVKGIIVSPGIAIGRAFVYSEDISVPSYGISSEQVAQEFERFTRAVEGAAEEIQTLKHRINPQGDLEGKFLDSHLLMVKDPEFIEQVRGQLSIQMKNVESVLQSVIDEMNRKLDASGDEYLKERSLDLDDIFRRLLGHLLRKESQSLKELDEECIVVAHNLLPSDLISMNKKLVIGIATDMGGKTSHTAILARSFEIPAVLGLSQITDIVRTGDEIVVDGNQGQVIVNPDSAVRQEYSANLEAWQKHERELRVLNELRAETRDGKLIELEANIEVPEEIDSVIAHGADGIGLFRSEFLYIGPNRFPSEEEQYQAYTYVLESMSPKVVTIRTLDLGGDKVIPGVVPGAENNPILGWRAVRFCMSQPEIFKAQLRALLRASVHGNLKIMFPMISGIEELDSIMAFMEDVKQELKSEGQPFDEDTPIGIMIEVPSAAFTSDILAKRVDFFSIGTNDLIQYTIAVDRENERIAYLYEPFHPGVLRLLKVVVDNAHTQGIPVGMCGEMAGEISAAVILLGIGLDQFSMSAISIPEIKKIIRSVTFAEAEDLVSQIMNLDSYLEVGRFVHSWMEARF